MSFRSHITPPRLIFMTMLIDMIGLGIIIPILPDLIGRFNPEQQDLTLYYGYFIGVYALMQFLAAPVLGALSDKFGRRPVLLVSLFGAGLDYLMMAFAPALWLLFVGRVISGISGASFTVANAYVADISNDKNRSANFGLIGAAIGLGFIAGPLIGGMLGHVDVRLPFLVAAGLNLTNGILAYRFLPETLPPERRREIDLRKLNPLRSVMRILKPSPILILVLVFTMYHLSNDVYPSNWNLYMRHKFGWDAFDVGLSLALVGVCFAFSQVVLTRMLTPRIGERRAIALGFFVDVIVFAGFALATQGWMIYGFIALFAFSGIALPALQAVIASSVPSNEQGELQGSLSGLMSLMSFMGPLMYARLFAHFTPGGGGDYFPGICFMTASGICLLALVFFTVDAVMRKNKNAAPEGAAF